jgi:hypothetical protein
MLLHDYMRFVALGQQEIKTAVKIKLQCSPLTADRNACRCAGMCPLTVNSIHERGDCKSAIQILGWHLTTREAQILYAIGHAELTLLLVPVERAQVLC